MKRWIDHGVSLFLSWCSTAGPVQVFWSFCLDSGTWPRKTLKHRQTLAYMPQICRTVPHSGRIFAHQVTILLAFATCVRSTGSRWGTDVQFLVDNVEAAHLSGLNVTRSPSGRPRVPSDWKKSDTSCVREMGPDRPEFCGASPL